MRILFAGTPRFAVPPLEALLSEHEVVGVYTQPDRRAGRGKKLMPSPVKQLALANSIPVHQPESLKGEIETIAGLNVDAMVVVAYGMILPKSILELPKLGCINIHASLLPRWRGAAPIQRAIEAGDAETGVAIMQMAAGLDTGPVYEMLKTEIELDDTSASLHDRLSHLGATGVLSTLSKLQHEPTLKPKPQDDSLASYAHKISKAEARLDWSRDSLSLHNQIRAFVPWPICETHHQGMRIRLWSSRPESTSEVEKPPGTVIKVDDAIHVACGKGVLALTQLQRDGARAVSAEEFCNGYSLAVGDRLGFIEDA